MCIFDFDLPIGWDELGTIATVAAVFAALWANHQARKQLKSALKMQELSKNVDLMDKRIALAESIQGRKTISELAFRILFNDEIFECYKRRQHYIAEENEVISAENQFLGLARGKSAITNAQGTVTYSLEDIRKRKAEVESTVQNEEARLMQLIEDFISKSIQSDNKI